MNIEDRITELEIQFAHQDNIISDLNDVIISQQNTIATLESRLLKVESVANNSSSSEIKDISEEPPPPHY